MYKEKLSTMYMYHKNSKALCHSRSGARKVLCAQKPVATNKDQNFTASTCQYWWRLHPNKIFWADIVYWLKEPCKVYKWQRVIWKFIENENYILYTIWYINVQYKTKFWGMEIKIFFKSQQINSSLRFVA